MFSFTFFHLCCLFSVDEKQNEEEEKEEDENEEGEKDEEENEEEKNDIGSITLAL